MRSADSAEQTGDERLVLVFGASGTVGTHLVPALLRAGRQVRASSRNRKALEARFGTELCQSARKRDPLSASKKDPLLGGFAEGGGWALVVERSGWSCG
jgi:NAD(P)-dependent dehydrogenase (short-subunit alcohol dehydrogenase family)